MLYENYQQKIIKISAVRKWIRNRRALIISVAVVIIAFLTFFTSAKGVIYFSSNMPAEITYGDTVSYKARAFFGTVSYEYAEADSDEWTEAKPKYTGAYKVRAVSERISGALYYSTPQEFKIVPRVVDVTVTQRELQYGDSPTASASLVYDDSMSCTRFIYADLSLTSTQITPDKNSVVITDTAGRDVTGSYIINAVTSDMAFVNREISVTTFDASAVYDGTPLSNDRYELSGGSLAYQDVLFVTFDHAQTDAGEIENSAQFRIVNADGINVTAHYNIETIFGMLTVLKREINIVTQSAEKVYDGEPLMLTDYAVSPDSAYGILAGHVLSLTDFATLTNAGSCENRLTLKATDGGTDVTGNYSFVFTDSTLTVTQRTIEVETKSATKTYDGWPLVKEDYTITSALKLLDNHSLKLYFSGSQTKVGSSENTVREAVVTEGDVNVTANYKFIYTVRGTLTVTKRAVQIQTESKELVYNGTPQTCGGVFTASGVADGQSAQANESTFTYRTNVGSVQNKLEVAIFDADENDVTENYEISYIYGTLTIAVCPVTVTTGTADLYYNGKKQYYTACTTSPAIAAGQSIRAVESTLTYAIKNAGDSALNVFAVKFFDAEGNDVTYNYNITAYYYGTVRIIPKPVTVYTNSRNFVYDGTPQIDTSFSISPDIVEGHTAQVVDVSVSPLINVERDGLGNLVGHKNEFSILILDEGGGDVMYNYAVIYVYGTVTMMPRPVTITTSSQSWEYDGTEHFNTGWSIYSGSLVLAHELRVTCSGLVTITNVGSVENRLTVEARIVDAAAGGRDISYNYDISYVYGTLRITPRLITVTTNTNKWKYDGLPHFDDGFTITSATQLVAWHNAISWGDIPSVTDILWLSESTFGSVENIFEIKIWDGATDVTYNYQITYIYGTLTIEPWIMRITTVSETWIYDGEAHSAPDVIYYDELGEGHEIRIISPVPTITIVGTIDNIFEIAIFEGSRKVEGFYLIYITYGTLTVVARPLDVAAGSASKVFDGTPLTCSDVYFGSGLLPGHRLTASTTGSQTPIGSSANIITLGSVRIMAGNTDVTDCYSIRYFDGTLSVYQKEITLKTGSAEKAYDGTALVYHEYEIVGDLGGHKATVTFTGTITNIGSISNNATIVIKDGATIVTGNYLIHYEFGTLTITDRSSGSGGGNINLDGTIDRTPNTSDGSEFIMFNATSDTSGTVYFRIKSFGDYSGDGWEFAAPYTSGMSNALYLMYLSLSRSGKSTSLVSIEILSDNLKYMLPYYASYGYYTDDDTMIDINIGKNYSYNIDYIPYTYNSKDSFSVPSGSYKSFEQAYYQYVLNTYLQLPESTRAELLKIAAKNNLNANSPTIISDIARFVQNAVKYDLNHENYSGDVALYFFTKAKTGICQHYATAATAMLRALGIPARYTIGFVGEMSAGKLVEVSAAQAHAWVEVYLPGAGWVQIEVTGSGDGSGAGGGIGGVKSKLTIAPVDVYKQYDGTALLPKNEIKGYDLDSDTALKKLLKAGYRYTVNITGSRTEYGVSESTIIEFVLYDPHGRNVTEEFDIVYKTGSIRITHTPLIIHLYDVRKYYDGTPLSYNSDDYWVEGLPYGYRLELNLEGSLTNAGMLMMDDFYNMPFRVFDANHNDVTGSFSLVFEGEPLRIYKCAIEITTASAIKTYDGTPLTNDAAWISKGSFPEGYYYEVTVTGKVVDIGKAENTISRIVIYNRMGAVVTDNFDILLVCGILEIVNS